MTVLLVSLVLWSAWVGISGLIALAKGNESGFGQGWRGFLGVFCLCGIPPLVTLLGLPLARVIGGVAITTACVSAAVGFARHRRLRRA
jgi:hypothetical protein